MSTIIFDNAGGVTLQFENEAGGKFAMWTHDQGIAAHHLFHFLADSDLSDWEGHDEDAASLNPTQEQIANGGYRVYTFDVGDLSSITNMVATAENDGWADEFCARMREAFARISD